jgi:hypothetical protein
VDEVLSLGFDAQLPCFAISIAFVSVTDAGSLVPVQVDHSRPLFDALASLDAELKFVVVVKRKVDCDDGTGSAAENVD